MAATPRRSGESPSEYRRRLEQMDEAATAARRGRLVHVPSAPVRQRSLLPARQETGPKESTIIQQDYAALEERVLASEPTGGPVFEERTVLSGHSGNRVFKSVGTPLLPSTVPRWRAIWERMKQAWRDL